MSYYEFTMDGFVATGRVYRLNGGHLEGNIMIHTRDAPIRQWPIIGV